MKFEEKEEKKGKVAIKLTKFTMKRLLKSSSMDLGTLRSCDGVWDILNSFVFLLTLNYN